MSASEHLVIYVYHFLAGLVPCDLVDLIEAVLLELRVHCRICDYRIDGIGHSVDVPVVGLYHIGEDLGASALL